VTAASADGARASVLPASRPTSVAAVTVLTFVVALGLSAPLLGYDPAVDVDPSRAGMPPSFGHWLGTDHLGRDIAMRLALACSSFVGPGLAACAVAAALGVPAGALAGYHGGAVASVVRYVFGVLASVPRFVLVLLALAAWGDSTRVLAFVAGLSFVPILGEAVHARIEELRTAEYVLANRAYGLPAWRILWVHLVWAACGPRIARQLVGLFGYFLVLETTLSYIGGFGVQEPTPSWGNMLVFEWGRGGDNPWNVLAPVLALWLTAVATAWLGTSVDGTRK
jgi:peptide/nickel transport system permease protein